MHPEARAWVAQHATDGRTLDIGGRDVNGTVRDLFGPDYTTIDLIDGPGVDVVGDVADYNPRARFDVIVCCEVLEHAEHPETIIDAAHRLLRKDGLLILTAAGQGRAPHSAFDGGPVRDGEHYRNITRKWLTEALAGWDDVTIDTLGDDIRAVATRR